MTVLAAMIVLAACGSHEQHIVHIYNWANYIGPDTVRSFEARTGIHVVYDTFDSEEMLEGKLLAGDSGYDVVDASCDIIPSGIQAGAFAPLDRARLPNWRHLDPHALAVFARFDPGNRYAVP